MTKRTSGRSTLLSALMLATAILPGSPSGGSVLPGNHLLPLSRRSPGTWVRTLKGVGEGMRGTDTPCSDCCDLLLRANVWPAPSLMEIELRLRGGGESGGDSDDDIGEKGTTMPPPIHVYPTEDSDDAEGVGGEAQNGQGGHEEDDAEEYLEMMRVCAEEVAGGRAELVDAYAILAEARDSGKNITGDSEMPCERGDSFSGRRWSVFFRYVTSSRSLQCSSARPSSSHGPTFARNCAP